MCVESSTYDLIKANSDFSFEMEVRKILNDRGATSVVHSGAYLDPLQKKYREFDLRAEPLWKDEKPQTLFAAIECKNISFNLLIHATKERQKEDSHWLIRRFCNPAGWNFEKIEANFRRLEASTEFVGRSVDEIRYNQTSGKSEFVKSNKEQIFYDKYSQAIHSLEAYFAEKIKTQEPNLVFGFVPFLVIIDVNTYSAGSGFVIPYLEIVTKSQLGIVLKERLIPQDWGPGKEGLLPGYFFPRDQILKVFK